MQLRQPVLLLILFLLSFCGCSQSKENFDLFSPLKTGSSHLDFITKEGVGELQKFSISNLKKEFKNLEHLDEVIPTQLRIGNNRFTPNTEIITFHLENNTSSEWLTLFNFGTDVQNPRRVMWDMIGTYTGSQNSNSCFYLKSEDETHSSLHATGVVGTLVISAGIQFPFSMPPYGTTPSADQQKAYLKAAKVLERRMRILMTELVPKDRMIYATLPERQLTAAERTFGLVQFWTEVKYNFAYFDQVPQLDWDAALQEYLPLVQDAKDDADYYRILERFCALLKDGHTNIYPPSHLSEKWDRPQLKIELVDDVPIVVNRSKEVGEKIPLGAQIIAIDGVPWETYLEETIYPYISSGGDHILRRWGAHDLLKGLSGSKVSFTYQTLNGDQGMTTLIRNRNDSDIIWEVPDPEWALTKFEILEDKVGHLTLNSFGRSKAAEEFLEYLPEIRKCQKLIIDLRKNGGGNSQVGYDILKYFTDKPLLTSSWRTREHRAANRAWGKFVAKENPETLNEWDRNNQKMYFGEVWHIGSSDTIQPILNQLSLVPVAVLVSNYTASAAEDFLVAADVLENFVYIGEPSFGSTGQPLNLSLPGGGSARICTKRDTYSDGREFVGPGVNVDIAIAPSIKDYLDKQDVVLAKALEVLKNK